MRLDEGDRPDAGDAVAQPQAQQPLPCFGQGRAHAQALRLPAAQDLHLGLAAAESRRRGDQVLGAADRRAVHAHDQVADGEARLPRGTDDAFFGLHLAEARDDHAVGVDLDADRLPADEQLLGPGGAGRQREQKQHAEQRRYSFFHGKILAPQAGKKKDNSLFASKRKAALARAQRPPVGNFFLLFYLFLSR